MTTNEDRQDTTERKGLATRHVFLDTSVYRSFGHNLASAPLQALRSHIAEARLCLHITDITLSEVERQIHEDAAKLAHHVAEIEKQLERWRSRVPSAVGVGPAPVNPQRLGDAAFSTFRFTITYEWKAREHAASTAPAGPVFARYFRSQAPFDKSNSKEFPDAFVISVLEQWCNQTGSTMYVVTADAAMGRAARESGMLIPINSPLELLQTTTAAETPEVVDKVECFLASPDFLAGMEEAIRSQIGSIGIIYSGDLPDGEAYEAEVAGVPELEDFSVLSASPDSIGVLVAAKVPLLVGVQYEDLSSAIYDREDGIYFGAKTVSTEIEDPPVIRLFVTIDASNYSVEDIEMITQDVYVSEPYEDYK